MNTISDPQLALILPTFCEADNLPRLVPLAVQSLSDAGFSCQVIVVDDASPDGTADVAYELAEHWPVTVIERMGERGLATAVLAGLNHASADICLVMDADGSHPTEALPTLAQAIHSKRWDIAVGSRLAPGGGFDDWPLWGRLKSRFAALFARGLTTLSDPTTGMMALRRDLLTELDLDPVGWKIVLEVVVKSAPRRVIEVPIVFGPRLEGDSKQSLVVFWHYLRHCARLYRYRLCHRPRAVPAEETS